MRLYQSIWNGIDLVDISQDPSRLTRGTPNALFYAEFYRRLRGAGYTLAPEWIRSRRTLSERLRQWLARAAASRGTVLAQEKILSLGAGLGMVEAPLIREGLDITLHEIAPEAFGLLPSLAETKDLPGGIKTLVGPLENIPDRGFDIVFVGSCEYACRDDADFARFLGQLHRILRDSGSVISWDYVPTWRGWAEAILRRALPPLFPDAVFWGVLRSPAARAVAYRDCGLEVMDTDILDADWRPGTPARYAVIHAKKQEKTFP